MKKVGYLAVSAAAAASDLLIKEYQERKGKKIVRNKGFAANRFDEHSNVVAAVSAALTSVIGIGLVMSPEDTKGLSFEKLGWALIFGGAVSNTVDRLKKRYVVDYIPIGKYVYNIGDFFIYIGAAMTAMIEFIKK
ncbi:MAG: signal peptidase II [Lachnospiraceae bacterium]|nr:signal peptidase II [Lachnospiraceae bacterium]